jgi:Protein of unknown function (DUF3551)
MKNLPLLAIAGLVMVGATALNPAPAIAAPIYPWCMQPSAPWGPDCLYATIEQCRAAASAVGFCHPNPAYTVAAQGKPDRMRRP